tara:strand:- start:38732 stop:39400 length:669 start_codon:yes stop_codon:yes gene_type:complete
MNLTVAKTNMMKQQLRTAGATDHDLLQAVETIAREDFMPQAYREVAYSDLRIRLEHDQMMLPPEQQAMLLQHLALQASDRVLEIGTGTGYLTALLARLTQQVTSVEQFSDFTDAAKQRLAKYNIDNVTLLTRDAFHDWDNLTNHETFDIILCTAALYQYPGELLQSLAVNGRAIVIVGKAPVMCAYLYVRTGTDEWQETNLFDTAVPYAAGITQPETFSFEG